MHCLIYFLFLETAQLFLGIILYALRFLLFQKLFQHNVLLPTGEEPEDTFENIEQTR